MALCSVSTHHKSRRFFQSACLSDVKKEEMLDYVQEQFQNMVTEARRASDRQGRENDDKQSFVEALVIAIADQGLLVNDNIEGTKPVNKTPLLSTNAKIKFLGLPEKTGYRLFKKQAKKKKDIMEETHVDGWVGVTSRDGFIQKVPDDAHERVVEWITKHHHVIHSPIAKDTIQVKNQEIGEWERKLKLLLQCSMAELLSNLYANTYMAQMVYDENGKKLISEKMLWALCLP